MWSASRFRVVIGESCAPTCENNHSIEQPTDYWYVLVHSGGLQGSLGPTVQGFRGHQSASHSKQELSAPKKLKPLRP
jgi:hypothetical protein